MFNLSNVRNLKQRSSKRNASKNRVMPAVDLMEGRMMLSGMTIGTPPIVSATLESGVLTIKGNTDSETITVRQKNGAISVANAKIMWIGGSFSSINEQFIQNIQIYGNGGNDVIHADSQTVAGQQAITKPITVVTGNGNDKIYGGEGNDFLYGVGGNDLIYGNGGNDYLSGSLGDDDLYGGDGDDTLNGDSGSDLFEGGAGFDFYRDDFNLSQPKLGNYSVNDVDQENNKTCQTLSALATMANAGFDYDSAIDYQGNNLYDIHVFDKAGKAVIETVKFDGTFSDFDPRPARDAFDRSTPEFWTILMQRARMQRYGVDWTKNYTGDDWNDIKAQYGDINSSPAAIQTFTGEKVESSKVLANGTATPDELKAAIDAKKYVVAGTGNVNLTHPYLINTHVYAVVAAFKNANGWQIEVYDPRRTDTDGLGHDGYITMSWNQFKSNFQDFVIC